MSTQYTNYTQHVNTGVSFKVGDEVTSPGGRGIVVDVDPVFEIITINHGDGNGRFMYTADQVDLFKPPPVQWTIDCECGAKFTQNSNLHSSWCPKYRS